MEVSVSDAKAQLTDLVRRAEAGEEVILTRHGQATVRIIPVKAKLSAAERRLILDEIVAQAHAKITPGGPSSKEMQDALYDEFGLPN